MVFFEEVFQIFSLISQLEIRSKTQRAVAVVVVVVAVVIVAGDSKC